MKILKNILKNELNIRTQKNYPIEGIEFIDITPLTLQKETFKEIINKFVDEIKDKDVDYIVSPEARGFVFGTAVAYELNKGFIPVRKKGKLPPNVVETEFEYEKEYGKDKLELPKLINEKYENKKFYIIDDIYATGNTINGIKDVIQNLGGHISGVGVVIDILELNNDNKVFSIIDINES